MIDITQVINALIALFAAIITSVIIPYIKKKTSAERLKEIKAWTKIAVQAAEILFQGHEMGAEKKKYVIGFLEENGFCLDMIQADALIESAVLELKNNL